MPQMNIEVFRVTVGGPYSYTISRNGSGYKTATGFQNFNTAWNAARDDAAALLDPGEVLTRASANIQSFSS